MKVAILSANLGNFDKPQPHLQLVEGHTGDYDIMHHMFTDQDFPPITGLSGRLQYRIPKLFGYEMFPGYDLYIWLDASMAIANIEAVLWFIKQLGDNDCAFFTHPWRETIKEEVDHIEDHLQKGKKYIVSRYKNGLHKEFLALIKEHPEYKDDKLFASNVFIYRNNEKMKEAMETWWFYQSRYFTCDQVQLPFSLWLNDIKVSIIQDNVFKSEYVSLVSPHK